MSSDGPLIDSYGPLIDSDQLRNGVNRIRLLRSTPMDSDELRLAPISSDQLRIGENGEIGGIGDFDSVWLR